MEPLALTLVLLIAAGFILYRIEVLLRRLAASAPGPTPRPQMPDGSRNGSLGDGSPLPAVRAELGAPYRSVVLAVSPDRVLLEQLSEGLADTVTLLTADTSAHAGQLIERHHPAVVLVDAQVRNERGDPFWEDVRRHGPWSDIPVVLVDGLQAGDSAAQRYAHLPWKPSAILGKPVVQTDLHRTIHRLVQVSGDGAGPVTPIDSSQAGESEARRFVRRAQKCVEENLSQSTFGVQGLSEYLGLSPRQVQRRLRETTGLSPNAFIRTIRLQHAARRLQSSDDPVSTIAWEAGFSSLSYFAKSFREQFGRSPSEYSRPVRAQ